MSITQEHGQIIVAIIAMLTLSALMFHCRLTPDCRQVPILTTAILLSVVGTMLGRELNVFNNRGGGGGN